MKTRMFAVLTAALAISAAYADPTNDLIAYFPFNGNANDASGQGHLGTATNGFWTSNRFGFSLAAYDLNGSNSYVDIPHQASIALTTNFTLSAWIYQRGVGTTGYRIIDKCDAGVADGVTFDSYACDGTGNRLRLQGVAGGPCNVNGSTDYSLAAWHHVVATVSGSDGKVYLDGNLDGSGSVGTIPDNPLDVYIGRAHPSGGAGHAEWFNGVIDDVRIYNRALSPEEVKELYVLDVMDTDHDGLSDYDEVNLNHTDPTRRDTDGDGLTDYQEVVNLHTDPLKADTDGDGFNDYAEIYSGHDPLNTADFPAAILGIFPAVELEFITKSNTSYTIQASPDLRNWSNFDGPVLG